MSLSLCCSSSMEPLNPNPIPQGFPPSKIRAPSSPRLFQTSLSPIKRDQLHNYTSNNLHKAVLVQPPHGLHQPYKAKSTKDGQLKYVRTLLLHNYDSYTFNIYQYLSLINNVPPVVVRNDEWTWKEAYYYLYEERAFDNIVISPGPGSPECPDDIGLCLQLLLECKDIPILGVCLGHQALGYVHGARIVHAPQPIHGRLSEIEHNDSELFHNIPSGRNSGFKVVRYHSLVIDAATLPKDLVPIAWTSSSNTLSFLETSSLILDPFKKECIRSVNIKSPLPHLQDGSSLFPPSADNFHSDKILMGIRHIDRPHYGLQFHPESVATSYGSQMFKNFRDITVAYWEGLPSSFNRNFNACSQVGQTVEPQKTLRSSRLYPSDFTNRYFSNLLNTSQTQIREVKLRWKKIDFLANEVGGARNIFCPLFGDCKAEDTFWLDSSSIEKRRARFSIMGKKGGSLWKQLTFKLSAESCGGHLSIEDAQGNTTSMYLENGFLDFLNKELQLIHCDEEDYHGLPFDFCGGYIGYIGYNLKVECGAASNRHNSCAPDACFFFVDNFIVIDHNNGDVYVMSIHEKSTDPTQWLDNMHQSLLSLKDNSTSEVRREHYPAPPPVISPFEAGFISEKSRDEYIGDVDKCLGYIRDGESYELCFTTQMRKNIRDMDPLGLYLKLREQNPAPYAAWLNFPNVDLCICSSSPERFLRLDRDGVLEAKPIKGTIARGSTSVEDEHLKSLLQYSEKDQAENLMIVDLLRNDLGQVCEPGSVHVPHLMEVETYATVHTMVSTIRGKKRENVSPVDCVRAAFPGGSMTGAPKLRSMEILDSLESCARGVYSGSIGYFSINRTFDLNIVIRSVVIHKGEASIGAGGAIVALSKPEDEYEEMVLKTRAQTRAIVACQS